MKISCFIGPSDNSHGLQYICQLLFVFAMSCIAATTSVNAASLDNVSIVSRLDPNAITITEVDIVFIYDETLLASFPDTKSRWYSMRRTLTQRWGDAMDIISVSIPQGFDSEKPSLPERRNEAVKVYIFGQHDEGDVPPADVTELKSVSVIIDDFGIIVSQ